MTDLRDAVTQWGIRTVVDVRENPCSHKRGFSGPALERYLGAIGVSYVHAGPLGSPKHLREQLKATGDYEVFRAACNEYFAQQESESLAGVLSIIHQNSCALLCFERQANQCHRSVLAALLCKMDHYLLNVRHI